MPPIFLHELTRCLPVRDDTTQPSYCPANHQQGYTCPINRCQYGMPARPPTASCSASSYEEQTVTSGNNPTIGTGNVITSFDDISFITQSTIHHPPQCETVTSTASGAASAATQSTPITLFPENQSVHWYDEQTVPPSISSYEEHTVTSGSSYEEHTVTSGSSYEEQTVSTSNPCPANMVCCLRNMCGQAPNPNPQSAHGDSGVIPTRPRPPVETVTSAASGAASCAATQSTPITLFPDTNTASAAPCQAEFDAYSNCLSQQPNTQQQSSHAHYVPPVISVPNCGCSTSSCTGSSGTGSYVTGTSGTGSYATATGACMLPNEDCIQECAKFRDYMRQKGCPNTVVCRNRPDPSIRRQRKRRASHDCDDCVLVKRC